MSHTSPPLSSYVESWTPGPLTDDDPLPPGPVAAVSALLDLPEAVAAAGEEVPPLWHWFYFLRWPAQRALGPDGHPSGGRFLPPVPDRQRMFAGGRCEILRPLRLGAPAQRVRSLGSVTPKSGRTGEMLFVTERHEVRQDGEPCLVEEQDLVYRSGRSQASGRPATPTADAGNAGDAGDPAGSVDAAEPAAEGPWQLRLRPDPTLLFRFSALTANAHRIHYDTPYAREQEGYPGLVVHGPLLALLMLELARREAPERRVRTLSYRLRRPVFVGEPLLADGAPSGGTARMHIATRGGTRHATAEVTFA
ncbi:hypothetical protein [Streptomyces odontomachi]|uniref:hypothetical protein n=1 Tax=Streptomyces odontomachi TaxID=2944940 RepID=UPI00210C7C5C|nr:hypothetical protein [Streptomyces sp. ODS25]